MNKLKRFFIASLLVSAVSIGLAGASQTTTYAATCKPQFTGGASGGKCPDDKDVPGYQGHTYHTINVKTTINDPSGFVNSSTKSEKIYCDCGRTTMKCNVSASKPMIPGRTGSFVGSSSRSAGGANGQSSTVTFTYKLDPVPPFQLTTTTTRDKETARPGEVVTFNHVINKASGRFPAANQVTWKGNPSREGPMYPYEYKNILEQLAATLQRKQQDNRYLDTKSGSGYGGGVTKVTIQKDTPVGAKICYNTTVKPSNNSDGTYSGGKVCTTVARSDFNLVPTTSLDTTRPLEPGEPLKVTYRVQNTIGSADDKSSDANWRSYGIKVKPGVSTTPITAGGPKDNSSPAKMIEALGGSQNASLFDVDKNQGVTKFPSNATTTLKADDLFQLPEDAAAGARYCFVLSVAPPTQGSTPENRHSSASCMVVGKKPKINVWGGDLFVGRRFANDPVSPADVSSSIQTSLSVYNDANRTYGSWTEYDAHASGTISGFATASGLQGGKETVTSDQSQWSKLTFANKNSELGDYATTNARDTIPGTAEAMMANAPVVKTFGETENTMTLPGTNPDNRKIARYDKPNGDLVINAGTIQRNTAVVITVPKGEVKIAGNLNYLAGPYKSVKEIPQLIIIAKNITINSNVTNVDGWLVAKAPADTPAGTEGDRTNPIGVIKTCDITTGLTVNICNQRLTVNGPVMSNQLILNRTAGLSGSGGPGARPDDQPAEIFNLRADTYLWIYSQGTNQARAITTYSRELGPRF